MELEKVTELFKRKRAIEILQLLDEERELNFKKVDEAIDSSSDTISSTLKILSEYGLVKRTQHNINDVRYCLTDNGTNALERIRELRNFVENDN